MDCAKCTMSMKSEEGLRCAVCQLNYHNLCAGISDSDFKKILPMNKPKWKCTLCKTKKTNSNSPAIVINKEKNGNPQSSSIVNIDTNEIIKYIENNRIELTKYIDGKFDMLLSNFSALKESVDQQLSSVTETVNTWDERIATLEAKVESMSNMVTKCCPTDGESPFDIVSSMENTITQLKIEINGREQELLLNDVEISGIREEKNENTIHIIYLVASKLGVSLEERDVVFAERVGPVRGLVEGAPAPRARVLAVRLARRATRDALLRAARVRRNLTTTDMGLRGEPTVFYVNERLTRYNRKLFQITREMGKKQRWRYFWTRDGKIFTRQDQEKGKERIRTETDLARVFGNNAVSAKASK